MDLKLISAVLGSSVFAAFLTQIFGKLKSDKQIRIENITKERKEWRDRLRVLLVDLTLAFDKKDRRAIRAIESELIIRLNPEDPNDIDILNMFPELYENWNEEKLRELSDRISYLLKHDWERVKIEASSSVTVYTLLIASAIACLSVYYLFYLTEEMLTIDNLKWTTTTKYLGRWMISVLFLVSIVTLVESKLKNPDSLLAMLFNKTIRRSYRKRSERKK